MKDPTTMYSYITNRQENQEHSLWPAFVIGASPKREIRKRDTVADNQHNHLNFYEFPSAPNFLYPYFLSGFGN